MLQGNPYPVGCNPPTSNLQDIKDKCADQPAKNMRHPTTSTCCLCWTAEVGNNSFFKTVGTCKMFCAVLRANNVIKVLILWSWQRHFLRLCTHSIYTQYNRTLCTHINVCTFMHLPWKPLHPLCSLCGYGAGCTHIGRWL